jgi:hypothetical protein
MRGFAIDLTDLVRRQAANADAPSNPPLPEAEAATLQERFAELNDNSVPPTPGTLVTYKPGLEQRRSEWTGHPLIVADQDAAGYSLPKFAAIGYVYRPDIAVLDLRPDGTAGIALLDSRRSISLGWELNSGDQYGVTARVRALVVPARRPAHQAVAPATTTAQRPPASRRCAPREWRSRRPVLSAGQHHRQGHGRDRDHQRHADPLRQAGDGLQDRDGGAGCGD